ncbi:MAG: DUF4440 domain-containing protein [Deltaproteobacteria bacterium]|nr:DUF4440 domain-containing protein [Deltaproteobacteria bacterium]
MVLIASPASAADDAAAGIAATNLAFETQLGAGSGTGLAALYTANGQLMPPSSDFVTGTEAIAAAWQAVIDSGIAGGDLETLEIEAHGDTATEVGTFQLRDAAGKTVDHGKFIVIWKKDGDSWKLHRDIFNSSMAPPAP